MTEREVYVALASLLKVLDTMPESALDAMNSDERVVVGNARKIVAAGPIIDWDIADPDPQPSRVQP